MLRFSFRFLAAVSWSVLAAPSTIQFQSSLYALDGTAVSGVTAISFALYTGESELEPVWNEQQSPLVEDGHYSVQLGSQQPFSAGLFSADQLWLGISVDGDELLPRTRLLAVPYAMLAQGVAPGAIQSDSLADDAIASRHLQAGAISSNHLANSAIASTHLSPGAVETTSVADSAITAPKLAEASVSARTLQDGAVTRAAVASGAVTLDALDTATVDRRYATTADGTLTGDVIVGESNQDTMSVRATLRIESGAPAHGKRLTSSAEGHTAWQYPNKIVHGFPLAGANAPTGAVMALQKDGRVRIADRIPRNYFDSLVTYANTGSSSVTRINDTRSVQVRRNRSTSHAEAVFTNLGAGRPPVLETESVAYDLGIGTISWPWLTRSLNGPTFIFVYSSRREPYFVTDLGEGNGVAISGSKSYSDSPASTTATDLTVLSGERFVIAYDGDRTNDAPNYQAALKVGRADGTFGARIIPLGSNRPRDVRCARLDDDSFVEDRLIWQSWRPSRKIARLGELQFLRPSWPI